jgi:Leucine-rich repeat (LRR) protein
LSSNSITCIENGIFQDLKKLTSLNLGWNQITYVHGELFEGLSRLEELFLRKAVRGDFQRVAQHKTIALSINKLHSFAPETSRNLSSFEYLGLNAYVYICSIKYLKYLIFIIEN